MLKTRTCSFDLKKLAIHTKHSLMRMLVSVVELCITSELNVDLIFNTERSSVFCLISLDFSVVHPFYTFV